MHDVYTDRTQRLHPLDAAIHAAIPAELAPDVRARVAVRARASFSAWRSVPQHSRLAGCSPPWPARSAMCARCLASRRCVYAGARRLEHLVSGSGADEKISAPPDCRYGARVLRGSEDADAAGRKGLPRQTPITNGSARPHNDSCLEWNDVVADPAYYAAGYCPWRAR